MSNGKYTERAKSTLKHNVGSGGGQKVSAPPLYDLEMRRKKVFRKWLSKDVMTFPYDLSAEGIGFASLDTHWHETAFTGETFDKMYGVLSDVLGHHPMKKDIQGKPIYDDHFQQCVGKSTERDKQFEVDGDILFQMTRVKRPFGQAIRCKVIRMHLGLEKEIAKCVISADDNEPFHTDEDTTSLGYRVLCNIFLKARDVALMK